MFTEIKVEAVRQGLKINQLAEKASITPCDLYSALGGKKPFYPNWRKRVAAALDVPESELFKDD